MSNIDHANVFSRSNVVWLVWEGPVTKPNYAWRECYLSAVLEANPELKFIQICEAIAAIEQWKLSPIESEEERWELARADEGIQALTYERGRKFV